jgi:Txe/YoeB family toxin of toxin-antitoxin system
MYIILLTRKTQKDRAFLKQAGLENKARALLGLLVEEPLRTPPACEKLVSDFKGCYFRRINIQHRLVYMVDEEQKTVKVLSMWSHYSE